MPQNVNVESEFSHNYKGANASGFHDVSEAAARHNNRGAVLANIFERYTTKDARGAEQVLAKDLNSMTYEMSVYTDKLPRDEVASAVSSMKEHLATRGYHE